MGMNGGALSLEMTGKKSSGLGADILTDPYNPGLQPAAAAVLPATSPVYPVSSLYDLTGGAGPLGLSWGTWALIAVGAYFLMKK